MSETAEMTRKLLSDGRHVELKRPPKYREFVAAVAVAKDSPLTMMVNVASAVVLVAGRPVSPDEILDMDYPDAKIIVDMISAFMGMGN